MIIKKLYYKKKIKEYLTIYRNFKILKKNNENLIVKLLYDLTNFNLSNKKDFFLNIINIPFIEIAHRQYSLETIIGNNLIKFRKEFVKKINDSKGISFPLIKQYEDFFKEKKVKFNSYISYLKMFFLILKEFYKGFILIVSTLFEFSKNFNYKINYVQFCDLPEDFKSQTNKEKYNIFGWFIKNYKNENIDAIVINQNVNFSELNNIKIQTSKKTLPPLSFIKKIYFLIFSIIIFFYCFALLFNTRKWYLSLMVREYIMYIKARLTPKEKLAKRYFFSQASYIYKPLWTYELENKNIEVIMYYYACSFDGYLQNEKYPLPEIGTSSMSWKKIFIWSKELMDHYKVVAKNAKFNYVNPIFYKDKELLVNIKKPSISIFDVAPYRPAIRASLYSNEEYRNYDVTKKFVSDICNLSKKYKVNVYYKSSKDLNQKKFDKKYFNFIFNLNKSDFFNNIDYSVSPFKLIEKTDISISLPWTSTGCIPKYFDKVCYYYDPISLLSKKDRGLQNGALISGYDELELVFKSNFILNKN